MSTEYKEIERKFEQAQNALVLQQSDLSLLSISDMVESGAIDISPKYQRRERWTPEKESSLIESFLLNIPVPPIYLAEDEYGTYSVIDGKQRITAISRFLRHGSTLSNLDNFRELEGATFRKLPKPLANALRIRPYLRVVTLLRQSDPDLKHEVFLRLNKAGVALNSQEIRNVAFRGKLNDLLFDLSENDYLRHQLKATPKSRVYREMTDVQYVLRFFTVRRSWKTFPGNMDKAMDNFMSEHMKITHTELKEFSRLFEQAIDACETIWGHTGFTRPGGSKRVMQGFYDIQMVCTSLLSDKVRRRIVANAKRVRSALQQELASNEDFFHAVTQFTSNPRNVRYRIERFVEILQAI